MALNQQQLVISDAKTALAPKVVIDGQPIARVTTRGFEAPVLSGRKSRRPSSIGIIAEALYGTSTRRSRSVSRNRPVSSFMGRSDQPHQVQCIPGHGYVGLPFGDLFGRPTDSIDAPPQVLCGPVQAQISGGAVAATNSAAGGVQSNQSTFKEAQAAFIVGPQPVLFYTCSTCGRRRSPQYHHNHPIAPGTVPLSSACRKCHNEYTSSEGTVEQNRSRRSHRKYCKYRRNKNSKRLCRSRVTNDSCSTDFENTLSEDSVLIDTDRRRTSRGRSRLSSSDHEEYRITRRSLSRGRKNPGLSIRITGRSNDRISREQNTNASSIHLTVEHRGRDPMSDSSSIRWATNSPVSSNCHSQHGRDVHLEFHGDKEPETDQLVKPVERSHIYRPAEEYTFADSRSQPIQRDTYQPDSVSRSNRSHYRADKHEHEYEYNHPQDEQQYSIVRRRSQSLSGCVPTPYLARKTQYFDQKDGVYSGHIHNHDQRGYDDQEECNRENLRDRLRALKIENDEPVRQDSWESTTVNVGGNRVSFRPEVSRSTLSPVTRTRHARTRYRPCRDNDQTLEDNEYDSQSDTSTEQRIYAPHRARAPFTGPASSGPQYLTSKAAQDSDTSLEAAFGQSRLSSRTRVPSRSPSYISRPSLRSRPQSPASTLSYRSRRARSPSPICYDRGRSQVRFQHASPPRRVPGAYGDELDEIDGSKRRVVVIEDDTRRLQEERVRSDSRRARERGRKRVVSWQQEGGGGGGGGRDEF